MKPIVLVTGGSGFVGSAIAHALSRDFDVRSLSRSTACPGIPAERNIYCNLESPEDTAQLAAALAPLPIFAVVHCAASTPRTGASSLEEHFRTNVFGTERVLAALPSPPSRIAYLSTVDVFGPGSDLRESSPAAPQTAYALSKYTGEIVSRTWCEQHGSALGIFRLGQVYGPGDPTAKAIPSFCRAAAAGKAPKIAGTGHERRQPIFVEDAASAVAAWLTRKEVKEFQTFVLSGPETISIASLAGLIMERAGLKGQPERFAAEKPATDICFDNSETRSYLNWTPRTSLAEGVAEVLASLRPI